MLRCSASAGRMAVLAAVGITVEATSEHRNGRISKAICVKCFGRSPADDRTRCR
ncbi:hypothetical protein WOLCODRAFT_22224 [Wolfiporia cocos MD-104 SS10]|uniref:Uncharacterized protein n=1 Tax=Wolfiporia cocos (strain MD-104) TaxID=742152 RepID=A0A2H3JAS9_WOLCO|nr:hypothetical protein WOLCODRAFT_22224 [Wolfiporia cocos MD-104 SS10]